MNDTRAPRAPIRQPAAKRLVGQEMAPLMVIGHDEQGSAQHAPGRKVRQQAGARLPSVGETSCSETTKERTPRRYAWRRVAAMRRLDPHLEQFRRI